MHLDEALRQRQPEPGALRLAGTDFCLLKLLEDPVEILGGDTRAGVGNGDRERFLAAGFDGYLSKPVNVADLVAAVARYCEDGSR